MAYDLNRLVQTTNKKLKKQKLDAIDHLIQVGSDNAAVDEPFHMILQPFSVVNPYNNIEIFEKQKFFYGRLDLHTKKLPLSITIWTKDIESREYEPNLREDLQIFISMNHKEPNDQKCDLALKDIQIVQMNQDGTRKINFTKELFKA